MMNGYNPSDLDRFVFRDLHPGIRIGTASDRYAGWIGQVYSRERYEISSRIKKVAGESLKEQLLPVESVREYFQHFSILEIDFTFYGPLLEGDLKPTRIYHVLETYGKYLGTDDEVVLKVPQMVFAQRLWSGGSFVENPDYLDAGIFVRQFYEPAIKLLGDAAAGFVFEQEYQPKKDRVPPGEYVEALNRFFSNIPEDKRYHIETRTESYHTGDYFSLLERLRIGHVLSHWTWLPPLGKQFLKSGKRFYNAGRQSIIRLLTPLRVKYEEAYKQSFPFDKTVEGMMSPQMIPDTLGIMRAGIEEGVRVNVIVNNRAGGNAPLMAQAIARRFTETV